MKRLFLLSLQYYRILLLFKLAFTVLWLFLALLGFGELNLVFWSCAAVFGFWSAVAIHYYYYAKENYYYFRNAGCRMRQIIALASIVDIAFYILLLLIFNLATHAIAYLESR